MKAAPLALVGVLVSLSLLTFDLARGNPVASDDRLGSVHVTDDGSRDVRGRVRAEVPEDLTVSRAAAQAFLSRPARKSRLKKLGMMVGGAYLGRKLLKGSHRGHSEERRYYGPGSYPPYYGGNYAGYGGGYGAGYGGGYGAGYGGGYGGGYRGMTREEYEEME